MHRLQFFIDRVCVQWRVKVQPGKREVIMTHYTHSKMMITAFAAALFSTSVGWAESESSNNYINFAIGMEDFDHDRGLKSEGIISIGFEHRYDQNWAAEFFLMDSSPSIKGSGGEDLDLTQYGIDALYYFDTNEDSNIQPYGAFGLGNSDFDDGTDSNDETQARIGLGLRYLLGDHWSIRADTRLLWSEETHTVDNILTFGLSFAFSPQKVMTKPEPAPEPVVMVEEPAPQPEPDSDSDGVIDKNDQCPDTDVGISVDAAGCALDGDNDAVPDSKDQCPSTEAGASVDMNGCMFDSDGDGVGNHRDRCPATPEGREVDAEGCKFVLTRTEEMTLKINFPSNSSNISEDQYAEIDRVAEFLQKYGDVSTVIEGHTDDRGAADYNQKLSQSRANAVRNVLIERYGIAASRVTAEGFGETRPIETNDTRAGRLANRRVVAVMKAQITE